VFCAIGSGCCFPLYGAVIRRLIDDRPPLSAVATVFGAAVLPAGFAAAVAGGHPFGDASTFAAVTYAGSISTAVAYVLWARGLRVLSLRDTVVISVLEPVVTAVLAVAILGQEVTFRAGVGVVLTVVGITLASGTGRGRQPTGNGIVNPCALPLIRQGDWLSQSPCVTNSDLGPAR
jgi:drug/metabolite transporter, DME family